MSERSAEIEMNNRLDENKNNKTDEFQDVYCDEA